MDREHLILGQQLWNLFEYQALASLDNDQTVGNPEVKESWQVHSLESGFLEGGGGWGGYNTAEINILNVKKKKSLVTKKSNGQRLKKRAYSLYSALFLTRGPGRIGCHFERISTLFSVLE